MFWVPPYTNPSRCAIFHYFRSELRVSPNTLPGYKHPLLFGSMSQRHYPSQRTLGSKGDPCKHRAPPPPDHTSHSSYSRYFVPWTGIPANKMAMCDCCLMHLVCTQKDTAYTSLKIINVPCLRGTLNVLKPGGLFFVIAGNRNSQFVLKDCFQSNLFWRSMIELVVDRCKIKTATQLTIFNDIAKKIIIITRAFIKKFEGLRAGLVVERRGFHQT